MLSIQAILILEILAFIAFMVVGIIYTNTEELPGSISFYSFAGITLLAIFLYSVPTYILSERFNYTQSKFNQGVDLAKKVADHPFIQNYLQK